MRGATDQAGHHRTLVVTGTGSGPREDESRPITVLVVEDEAPLADVVAGYLGREGYTAEVVHDGLAALERARALRPDLVVLDVMLPGLDGFEVCRRLRTFSDAYVVMLTARDEEMDTVVGLSVGADDYVVKPFSPRELVARVRAMLRRPRVSSAELIDGADASHPPVVEVDGLRLDAAARRTFVDGREVSLTRTEFDLLTTLAASPAVVVTRRELIEAVWGPGWFGDDHVVDVHIAALRRKLADSADRPRWIRTVRGVGYGMVTAPVRRPR
jgi:DNA-binding response OmpR family regulator